MKAKAPTLLTVFGTTISVIFVQLWNVLIQISVTGYPPRLEGIVTLPEGSFITLVILAPPFSTVYL
jgi:hypothetical protein